MVKSECSIIIFSKYFKIQFAWSTFQKRSWTVMTIMSTNRKNKNAWEIPSMETCLTSIMIREKNISKKDIFYLHEIYSIQSYLFSSHLVILKFKRIPSVFMYAINIQNDVIGLVLRKNCKLKQMTDFIVWPSRCHDTIHF